MIPEIAEGWIYSMVIFGFIGCLIIFGIILMAGYFTWNVLKKRTLSKLLVALNFTVWIGNFLACIGWAFLRSNLFYNITHQRCIRIYIFNYLSYMIAKLCIHILLLYRLFVAFKGSMYQVNLTFIRIFITFITITFCVFTSLWIKICIKHVTIATGQFTETLKICTLYNNYSNLNMNIYDELWPIIFGGQDLLIGFGTLVIFLKKITDISATTHQNDPETETLIRKLSILGPLAIFSTFIFYTVSVPFFPNLTFLLPFDAVVNSLCIVLLLEFSTPMYARLCCCMDKLLKMSLKHAISDELFLVDVMSSNTEVFNDKNGPKSDLELHMKKTEAVNDSNLRQTNAEMFNKNKLLLRAASSLNNLKNITSISTGIIPMGEVNLEALPSLDLLPLAASKYSRSAFL